MTVTVDVETDIDARRRRLRGPGRRRALPGVAHRLGDRPRRAARSGAAGRGLAAADPPDRRRSLDRPRRDRDRPRSPAPRSRCAARTRTASRSRSTPSLAPDELATPTALVARGSGCRSGSGCSNRWSRRRPSARPRSTSRRSSAAWRRPEPTEAVGGRRPGRPAADGWTSVHPSGAACRCSRDQRPPTFMPSGSHHGRPGGKESGACSTRTSSRPAKARPIVAPVRSRRLPRPRLHLQGRSDRLASTSRVLRGGRPPDRPDRRPRDRRGSRLADPDRRRSQVIMTIHPAPGAAAVSIADQGRDGHFGATS